MAIVRGTLPDEFEGEEYREGTALQQPISCLLAEGSRSRTYPGVSDTPNRV
jgi:hypothetical protein